MADTTQSAPAAKAAVWNDPFYRQIVYQVVLLALIIWVGYSLVDNTLTNMEARNISSGFGFLDTTAGFGIIQSLIPYTEESSYGRAFSVSLLNTILVAVIGILLATIIGFIVGISRLSTNFVIRNLATAYIEVLRNIPLLLQIFFWYFAVLQAVPGPRASINLLGAFFINNHGFYRFIKAYRWMIKKKARFIAERIIRGERL